MCVPRINTYTTMPASIDIQRIKDEVLSNSLLCVYYVHALTVVNAICMRNRMVIAFSVVRGLFRACSCIVSSRSTGAGVRRRLTLHQTENKATINFIIIVKVVSYFASSRLCLPRLHNLLLNPQHSFPNRRTIVPPQKFSFPNSPSKWIRPFDFHLKCIEDAVSSSLFGVPKPCDLFAVSFCDSVEQP